MLREAAGCELTLPSETPAEVRAVLDGLTALGITNAVYDASIVRGFNYYTGTVFEVFDTSAENNRALLGGGRYDNLTALFGGEPVTGIGFGMGDVTMRDFLETHGLLSDSVRVTAPALSILPTDSLYNLSAERLATTFRDAGIRTNVDLSTKKIAKKIGSASDAGVQYIIVLGEDEEKNCLYTLKNLATKEEVSGAVTELLKTIK